MAKKEQELTVYRYEDDGKPLKVYLRKCRWCGCWFGTPHYNDTHCCTHCLDAQKRRDGNRWRRGKDGRQRQDG